MDTKVNILTSALLTILLMSSISLHADTFYVCTGATLNLSPSAAPANTHYVWDIKQGASSITGYPSATAPTSLPSAGTYELILTTVLDDPANTSICPPDPTNHTLIVLPALSIALNAPSTSSYCATSGVPSATVAQTTTGFPSGYGSDLEREFRYTVVKDADTPVDGATLGTVDQATGTYTLNTTTAATYKITGYVKYKQKAGATGTLLNPSNGCEANSSATQQTVTVTVKPAKPTLTITAN
ncbi:MAG: hypothetical protein REI78_04730 [Pedobacter sp.]|nr:hypothetical protein [Pedobacter sp.]